MVKPQFQDNVNHVNYSRHSPDQAVNDRIMGTATCSETEMLHMFDALGGWGINVTLVSVIDDTTAVDDIHAYINFAKRVDASSVSFRKLTTAASDLGPTKVEQYFKQWND